MNANKINSRINPSKKEGFNFKERIKKAASGGEIDSNIADAIDADAVVGLGEASRGVLFKLKSLAKRKKTALANNK